MTATGLWPNVNRSRYLVKRRTLVPNAKGKLYRRGPWYTVKRFNDEGSALEYAAKLSGLYDVRVFYQGKRI